MHITPLTTIKNPTNKIAFYVIKELNLTGIMFDSVERSVF